MDVLRGWCHSCSDFRGCRRNRTAIFHLLLFCSLIVWHQLGNKELLCAWVLVIRRGMEGFNGFDALKLEEFYSKEIRQFCEIYSP